MSRSAERCDRLVKGLSHCPGVVSVRANPVTCSLLVEHGDGGLDVIARYGRELDLFELDLDGPSAVEKPPGVIIEQRLERVDAWIRAETGGHSTLSSVTIVALLAGAVWQAARGQLLPAGATLLWYAVSLAPARTRRILGSHEPAAARGREEVPVG